MVENYRACPREGTAPIATWNFNVSRTCQTSIHLSLEKVDVYPDEAARSGERMQPELPELPRAQALGSNSKDESPKGERYRDYDARRSRRINTASRKNPAHGERNNPNAAATRHRTDCARSTKCRNIPRAPVTSKIPDRRERPISESSASIGTFTPRAKAASRSSVRNLRTRYRCTSPPSECQVITTAAKPIMLSPCCPPHLGAAFTAAL